MLFSFFSHFGSSKTLSYDTHINDGSFNPIFNDLSRAEKAFYLTDFTLFHHENHCKIDLLLFLPHYGLFLGEKIPWSVQELKGASVKRFTRKSHAASHTQLEAMENIIYQKLQDVLSFDSTPLERIFWMTNLTSAEFETLHPSFHELLPKTRLVFKEDTANDIACKLHELSAYQTLPYSQSKVIGSLRAHTLLLPTATEPFGAFLSSEQQLFLETPIKNRSVLVLNAPHSSGKSTVLIRKTMDYLLTHPKQSVLVITPTQLSGELFRNEFIALMEFAVVQCDLSRLHFYVPSQDNPLVEPIHLFQQSTLIVCDDAHLLPIQSLEWLMTYKGSRSLLLSSVTNPVEIEALTLSTLYRKPVIHTIRFTHTKGALFTLLTGLKEHLETIRSNLIMIILPTHEMLIHYQQAIEDHLQVQCRVLNSNFSLQHDDLEEITLSTPEYISGLHVPHSYLINLDSTDTLYYPLALSRASDTITIISESNLEG